MKKRALIIVAGILIGIICGYLGWISVGPIAGANTYNHVQTVIKRFFTLIILPQFHPCAEDIFT